MTKYKIAGLIVFLSLIVAVLLQKYPTDEEIAHDADEAYIFNSLMDVHSVLQKYEYRVVGDWELVLAKVENSESDAKEFFIPFTREPIFVRKLDSINQLKDLGYDSVYMYTSVQGLDSDSNYYGVDWNLKPLFLVEVESALYFSADSVIVESSLD